jgi:ribosomal protein L22
MAERNESRTSEEATEPKPKPKRTRRTTAKESEAKVPDTGKPTTGEDAKPAAKEPVAKRPVAKKPARKQAAKAKPKPEVADVPVLVRASARYVRIAPRKARLVADQVRGLQIDRARALLDFSPRSAARDIRKLIDSAASNAENNHELVADDMKIAEINVDEGPTMRRYRARALGRATRINKRTSHISVALTPEE